MNKKILLPLLILGLGLTACGQKNPPVTPSEPDTPVTPSEPDTPSEEETPIWEQDLVDGETALSALIDGTDGEYYMVRGTVVGRSGSTMALARGDDFVYCYNFKVGEASIAEYTTGNYVEVYAQISHYEGSVQLTAYVDGAYDANAYVEVLEAEGETIAPTVLNADNFSTIHTNTNAGLLVKAEGLVNVSGAFTAAGTSANEDAKFTLGENNVTVRLEKYFDQATRADFVATLDQLEATATYTIVAIMTASSGGGRLLLVDSSTVTKTAEPTVTPEPDTPTTTEEPAIITVSTFAEALSGEEMKQSYAIADVTVTNWYVSKGVPNTDGTKYGNFYVTDGTTEVLVYGATASATDFNWDEATATYPKFANPQDFLTNELTSTIVLGSVLDIEFIVTSYNGTKQLNAIVKTVDNSNIGGETGGEEGGETGGDVTPGATATFTWTDATQESFSTTQAVYSHNGITITNDKASSTTNIRDCKSSSDRALRLYKGSNVTFTTAEEFTQIVLQFDTGYDSTTQYCLPAGTYGAATATLNESALTATLTFAATTSLVIENLPLQIRVLTATVTYAA